MAAIGIHEWTLRLGGAPRAISESLGEIMADVAEVGEIAMRNNISSRLTVRSRSLLTSARVGVVKSGDMLTLTMAAGGDYEGLRVRYARLQELGGTILPVKGRYLAIPQPPALTGPGIPKYPTASVAPWLVLVSPAKDGYIVKGRHGEALTNVASITNKIRGPLKGPCLVHQQTGEVWYRLVRRAIIKPHWFMRDAAQTASQDIERRLGVGLATNLEGVP